ncbi:hypothetical protein CONPUDRAFT_72222 [Coniophora puteana RWD-64-598 SS2]|uniref:Uncharacterized protein n=1 Tax=Coniophora puteana (strain RWD-64-598) TaxID=741705 RepID=A0A5M3MTH8_CONPW|nr:uncharacterized protein CONPUDRAFT_72222 [Coniophora puteana RWD-64-598 SS2]EIW81841.1 hypothetical protein CONPUDRAFT_72222 [Coniophora puteana RWD-64-598 SS2]
MSLPDSNPPPNSNPPPDLNAPPDSTAPPDAPPDANAPPEIDARLTDEVKRYLETWRTEWGILAGGADAGIRRQNLNDLAWKLARYLIRQFPYTRGGLTDYEDPMKLTWQHFDPNGSMADPDPEELKALPKWNQVPFEHWTPFRCFLTKEKAMIINAMPEWWVQYKEEKVQKGEELSADDLRPCPEDGKDGRWLGHLSRTRANMWFYMTAEAKEEYITLADQWNQKGAPKWVQKRVAQKRMSDYLHRHYLYCLRQFGAESVTWIGWIGKDGNPRVAHSVPMKNPSTGSVYSGDPNMFHLRHPVYFDMDKASGLKDEVPWPKQFSYHIDRRFLVKSECPADHPTPVATRKAKRASDRIQLDLRNSGYPLLPDDCLSKGHDATKELARAFLEVVYHFDTGTTKPVPWKSLSPAVRLDGSFEDLPYDLKEPLPSGVTLRDPSKMTLPELRSLLAQWSRILDDDNEPIHFLALCNPSDQCRRRRRRQQAASDGSASVTPVTSSAQTIGVEPASSAGSSTAVELSPTVATAAEPPLGHLPPALVPLPAMDFTGPMSTSAAIPADPSQSPTELPQSNTSALSAASPPAEPSNHTPSDVEIPVPTEARPVPLTSPVPTGSVGDVESDQRTGVLPDHPTLPPTLSECASGVPSIDTSEDEHALAAGPLSDDGCNNRASGGDHSPLQPPSSSPAAQWLSSVISGSGEAPSEQLSATKKRDRTLTISDRASTNSCGDTGQRKSARLNPPDPVATEKGPRQSLRLNPTQSSKR